MNYEEINAEESANDLPQDESTPEPEINEESLQEELETEDKEIASLKEQLKAAEENVDDLKDRMLRVQADFENFRKRTQREKEDLAQYTKEEVVKKLLPVLDNFDLAISHASTENLEAYAKGVELVAKQLRDVLESEGLKEIEAEGTTFDPNFHHGVAVDNNPELEDQQITEVFQKGYQLKDKVLRPSMVKVNSK